MQILFFDTETNGEIISQFRTMRETEFFPRVIQLAWLLTDGTGQDVGIGEALIKPDGWEIPQEKFWLKNGFTTEKNQAQGVPMPGVLDLFLNHYNVCSVLVAHNMAFDFNVLGAELIRYGKRGRRDPARVKICTMTAGVMLCKIPRRGAGGSFTGWKYPRLSELYLHLFGEKMVNAHNAMGDVLATKKIFFELVKREIIKL